MRLTVSRKIANILTVSNLIIFCVLKVRFGGQKVSPLKNAAKTIMFHRCHVENREDTSATMVEK